MPCLSKMRVGIFGGAFDPPHLGHERAALAFVEKAKLDLLYVIPSGKPPHKVISGGAEDGDRLEMSRRAFLPLSEKICISDAEILDQGTCYSYLTVERIRKAHSDSEIFLFIGTDQFLEFETWRRFEYILKLCTLCVMDRFENPERLYEKKSRLEKDFGARLLLLEEKPYIISSTAVRTELKEKGFSDSLSPAVNEWIVLRGIYGALADPAREALVKRLKEELSLKRLSHVLSVEREAVRLAKLLSLSPEKTRELSHAALYHDLTKEWSEEKMLSLLRESGEALSEEDLAIPSVLHGRCAAVLAARETALSEEALLAIRYHTTGKKAMSLTEKILYFADYTEELRCQRACREMRAHFYAALPEGERERQLFFDRCVLAVMENVSYYLKENKIPMHSLGGQALADLKKESERKLHDCT